MSFEIKKVYTDNPYVDLLVYYTKILGLGTVLKMQDLADNNETVESLKAGGIYISCVEGTAILEEFELTREALNAGGIILEDEVNSILDGYKTITDATQKKDVTEYLRKKYIEDYVELNPYYRMLHGLPPTLDQKDYVDPSLLSDDAIINTKTPIHEMSNAEVALLEKYGILDDMIAENPKDRQYMRYLGKKKIDYYLARRANKFDILYIPTIDSNEIYQMYRDKLDENKFYTLRTVYSEAFKYDSDYYDNFIAVFIVIITIIDIISRVQEFIARKEIFDIRSVEYLFKSYGVPFFAEIPLKYQIAMVKNLNTLLKYKSTSKCMVDICSLFGFNNVKVFKYYLLKDRKTDITTGEFIYSESDDPEQRLRDEYELKFLKLPLDGDLDKYIRSNANYRDYDEITDLDAKWDGGLEHDAIIKEILKEEFNFTRTKYISIDTIYDIAKMSAQQSYFFNFLYDNVDLESELTVQIPYISAGMYFKISDIFTLLTALTYQYNGIKDIIIDTQSNWLYVNGFNFKVDLAILAEDGSEILDKDGEPLTLRKKLKNEIEPVIYPARYDENRNPIGEVVVDLRSTAHARKQLDDFKSPTSSIPSFKEMMDIYVNNLKVRDELIKGMQEADNKKVYDVYKKLYDALMITEFTMDYYKYENEEGEKVFYKDKDGDATYSEYLKNTSPMLYSIIMEIDNIEDDSSKNQYIANIIDNITYALEEYIDAEEFQSLFSNLPIMSSEAVKQYMGTIINFYKSYKVDFLGFNTVYTIDDKNEEIIRLIDSTNFNIYFERSEFLQLKDQFKSFISSHKIKEALGIVDKAYLDVSEWIEKYFSEDDTVLKLKEKIASMIVKYTFYSEILLYDTRLTNVTKRRHDSIDLYSQTSFTSKYSSTDDIGIHDRMWINLIETEPRYQYHISNVLITNGYLHINDNRITNFDTAVFVPDLNIQDIIGDIGIFTVKCGNGFIEVTSSITSYNIPGEIIVN